MAHKISSLIFKIKQQYVHVPELALLNTGLCIYVVLMTFDLVECPQAPHSPICLPHVSDSLSTQQVLSGVTSTTDPHS